MLKRGFMLSDKELEELKKLNEKFDKVEVLSEDWDYDADDRRAFDKYREQIKTKHFATDEKR